MKTSLLIPVVGAILVLAACSDSEPVQQTSTNDTRAPAPAAAPATTSTITANELPAQRGNQATINGSAKTNPSGTAPAAADVPATGVPTAGNPPVLRGEQATAVGEAKAAAPSATTADAGVPDTMGSKTEAQLTPGRDAATKAEAQAHAADDSGRNKREDGTQPTPLDQGTSEADLKITQGIRATVVGRDDLSVNAKNAKIITRDGVVTLRGPVANAQERETVATIAKSQVGVTKIDNLLEPLQQ